MEADDKASQPRLILARYDIQRKDLSGAKALYREINAIAPNSPETLRLGAELAQASGSPRESVRLIRRLLKDNPGDPDAHVRLAILLLADNKVDEARINLRAALDADKNPVVAQELLARIAMRTGASYAVRARIKEIRQQPENRVVADILDGDFAIQKGDRDKAASIYRKVLSKNPDNRIVMLLLYFLRKKTADKEAKSELEDWLKTHPDDLQLRMVLAREDMAAVNYKRAAKLYDTTMEQEKDNIFAFNNLAWIYDQPVKPRALDTASKASEAKQTDGTVFDAYS